MVKKVGGVPPEALGPWIYALALDSIEIKGMCMDGGEWVVFRELDQRFPDKVAADYMGEAMEATYGLKILKKKKKKDY